MLLIRKEISSSIMYSSKLFQTGRHWRVYISKFPFQSVLLLETQFLRQAAHKKRLQMLEQREKVGKLCKAVDIRERPSLRSAEHGLVQSCWHHTKNKSRNENNLPFTCFTSTQKSDCFIACSWHLWISKCTIWVPGVILVQFGEQRTNECHTHCTSHKT